MVNKCRLCLALCLVLTVLTASGQHVPFTSDLPGSTGGTDVLPKGRFQWETTVGFERQSFESPATNAWTINSSMLRLGITEFAELRLQGSYLFTACDGIHTKGFSDVSIGTKVKFFRTEKLLPNISLLANVLVPGGKDADFLPENWGGQIGLLLDWDVNSWITLSCEGDIYWKGEKPDYLYGFGLNFDLSSRAFLAVDEYNQYEEGDSYSWLALSFAYQLAPRLLMDVSTDFSLNDLAHYQNLMVGLAWQITKD